MQQFYKEPTPVQYSTAGVKRHHYFRNKKGVRLHWHDRMELIRLHTGQMQVGYGENTGILNPGGVYIVPPKTPHAAQLLTDAVEYDVLMFDVRRFYNDTQVCQNMLPGIFDGRVRFAVTVDDPQITEAFDRVFSTCETDDLQAVAWVYRLLHVLLTGAATEFSGAIQGDSTILEAVDYIKENYAQELSTELLAQKYGYSAAHFCRKFKEATWLTPMNYLRIHRLEEAARMLRQRQETVSDIALRCGFPDPNYFTRCFKSHFGVPPKKYGKTQ